MRRCACVSVHRSAVTTRWRDFVSTYSLQLACDDFIIMGCTSSKIDVPHSFDSGLDTKALLPQYSAAKPDILPSPPSPILPGKPAPWVRGHTVFVLNKDGTGGVLVHSRGL
ncbi:hypothetical protein BV25DRAFT_1234403 [Artomyces pyxidatus]|uniref:Uncharacterized protein n=1 Tax=Artomyces pyxidatus TaxID=48021 RepID=A0ACB8SPI4_9AGAM|nr:hypothetical protein BV25DRAFT_1234403 [Artomyces pyxidatus]